MMLQVKNYTMPLVFGILAVGCMIFSLCLFVIFVISGFGGINSGPLLFITIALAGLGVLIGMSGLVLGIIKHIKQPSNMNLVGILFCVLSVAIPILLAYKIFGLIQYQWLN